MEQFVKEKGFKSLAEFHTLVARIDITTPERIKIFKNWQHNDGTKEGLLKIYDWDWYNLLKRYMAHVIDCEGYDFIHKIGDPISDQAFSDTEIILLKHISKTPIWK